MQKVLASLNSPADVNAIAVVVIATFCKTTKKTLIGLHRGCAPFQCQPAARKRTKRKEENQKWHKLKDRRQRQSGFGVGSELAQV